MKKVSLVLGLIGTLFLTACGSSGGSSSNNATQQCGVVNGQVYPAGTTYPTGTVNANCGAVPAGYTNINGQWVYTGATGVAGVSQASYSSNPCLYYGPSFTPIYSYYQNTWACISYAPYSSY